MKLRAELFAFCQPFCNIRSHVVGLERAETHALYPIERCGELDRVAYARPTVSAVCRKVYADENYLRKAFLFERGYLFSYVFERLRTHAPARIWNDTVGAETVAAVLDFDRRPRALAKIVYQLAREFFAVFVLSYANDPLTRAEEFIDHVGNLLVRAVAGDDIRLGEQTRVLGERLRHAAREHYNGVRMQLSQMAHILPRLAVALGGYGAGVDYVDIRLFARPYTFEAALYQRLLHRLRFILIDLAPESAECDFHVITAAKAALPLSFAVKLYSISPSCASPRG